MIMNQSLRVIWNQWNNLKISDPDQLRRGRLLNIILFGLFLMFIGALVYNFLHQEAGFSDWEVTLTYISTFIMLIGTGIIYLLNRYVSSSLAASLFLLLITTTIFFADTPHESVWGRNMIPLVIPIIMASVIVHQAASFVVAGAIVCVSMVLTAYNNLSINFIGAFAYMAIAWVTWLSARTLENALSDARKYLQQLQDTQAQLIRQEKLAALGQISGSIAHELRNPLGGIKNAAFVLDSAHGFSKDLPNPLPTEDVMAAIDIINREVTASERIINNLLDFTRPKLPMHVLLDVNEIVNQSLQRSRLSDSITIKLQLEIGLPKVLGDPDQLNQVLINLITNAIQSMPMQGELTLKTQKTITDIVVIISDTGVGIPQENIKNIFEPLFTTKAKGMGLGLFVSRKIIEAHEGRIEFSSVVGQGTTVKVYLPITQRTKLGITLL